MEIEGDKILQEVRNIMDSHKRKHSDSSTENSPKRKPVNIPAFSKNAPEWVTDLANFISTRIDSVEDSLSDGIDFATDTSAKAMAEIGTLRVLFKEQSRQVEDVLYQISHLKVENTALKEQVNNLENHSRRDNLLFYGFPEQKGEKDYNCTGKVYDLLRYRVRIPAWVLDSMLIVRCHRKGPYTPGKARPIIVKFHYFPCKQLILSHAWKLKGSNYFINEDFSADTENKRKSLYPIVKAARNLPEYKDNTSLHVNKLMCKGKSYTVDTIYDLPSAINPATLATETTSTTVKFLGRACPLSNFHQSPQVVNGIHYSCNEQYYHESKANFFEDYDTAGKIMSTSDPVKMKKYGESVKGFSEREWRQVCDKVMKAGLDAKFKKQRLRNYLKNTGDRKLAECNANDRYWSTGVFMSDPRANNPVRWPGDNNLGKILEVVRDEIKSQSKT